MAKAVKARIVLVSFGFLSGVFMTTHYGPPRKGSYISKDLLASQKIYDGKLGGPFESFNSIQENTIIDFATGGITSWSRIGPGHTAETMEQALKLKLAHEGYLRTIAASRVCRKLARAAQEALDPRSPDYPAVLVTKDPNPKKRKAKK